jgi:uncharacterized protein YjbI with pentapeptide repeats
VDIRGVRLRAASLDDADLSDAHVAKLGDAPSSESTPPATARGNPISRNRRDFAGVNLCSADLRGARINDAMVDDANFQDANLWEIPTVSIAWLRAKWDT